MTKPGSVPDVVFIFLLFLCAVMELMVGSLDRLLYGPSAKKPDGSYTNNMSVKRQLRIASGVAAGLAFLHANDVAHRDLKSSNVLYDRDLRVKVLAVTCIPESLPMFI